jgi:hypothetical protein
MKRLRPIDIKAILRDPSQRAELLQLMVQATIEVGRDNTKPYAEETLECGKTIRECGIDHAI